MSRPRQTVMPFYAWVVVRLLALALVLVLDACAPQAPPASTPATFADLGPTSVALLSAQDGWGVTAGASVPPAYELHLQQGVWTRVPLDDTAEGLSKVVFLSPTDGWAVGAQVYHYDGIRWTRAAVSAAPQPQPQELALTDVAFRSPSEGWAVGVGRLLHYHSGQWTDVSASLPLVPPPTLEASYTAPGLHGLALVSPTEGWAVGNLGVIVRFDGTTWRLAPAPALRTPYQDEALFAVALAAPGEGWAVGGWAGEGWAVGGTRGVWLPYCLREPGVIERLTGGTWTLAFSLPGELDGPAGQPTLLTLALQSATEGWAAGALLHQKIEGSEAAGDVCTASSYMLHLSGGQWTAVPVPDVGPINGLAFDSPDDGWAAADGGLLHYHAGTWTAVRR
jgi:hypothetical protein